MFCEIAASEADDPTVRQLRMSISPFPSSIILILSAIISSVHPAKQRDSLKEYPEELMLTVQAADLLVNAGLGFGVGVVASVLLFRRKLA
jgi:hypothetical protein